MADEQRPISVDTTGAELLAEAMRSLLNQFPGLPAGKTIRFEQLDKDSGIAFSADDGALVMEERVSITDFVTQICQYPFFVIYRTDAPREAQKLRVQSFLDTLGAWLCMETVVIDGEEVRLDAWPDLTRGRVITKITRMNAYGLEPNADGVQDWLLPVTVTYTNEFDRW